MTLKHERETVADMIRLYCRGNHGKRELCEDCAALLSYASERLGRCPFGDEKPVCSQCTIHCYKPEMRQRITAVMRYAGPRMAMRHPLGAVRHLVRKLRGSRNPRGAPGRRKPS
jgi:hypothetical protein